MAQPPFLTDAIQIEPSSGDTLVIERNSGDGSLSFLDPQISGALRLRDLAGLRNISGIFTVGTGDGAQYLTIQEAVDATPTTSSAASPSLILVGPGTYTENLTIQKDGIFIIGLGAVRLQPTIAAPTVLIEAGTTTIPRRVHLEGLTINQPHHGKEVIRLDGGSGSLVGFNEISVVQCDLEATGVGSFQVRSETVNRVRIEGGTWGTSSSTSLVRVNETAEFVVRDLDETFAFQLDYNTSDPLPAISGSSTYRVQNIGIMGNLQTELVGAGEFHLSGAPQVGDVTVLGDQNAEITGSRVQDLLANGTTTVRIVGTSFDSFGGTGTVLEWDGLTFSPPSAGGGGTDTITLTAAANVDLGDAVALDSAGDVVPATSTFTSNAWNAVGISTTNTTTGNAVTVYVGRALVQTKFTVPPGAASNNQDVFLDAIAGEVTLTPPTTSGNVIVRVGVLQGADGISLTPDVLFIPEIIAQIP